MIGVGQRVQILLSGLDLRVPHPVHHTFEVSAAREKPRSVRVAEIVQTDAKVDARCFDSRQPGPGADVFREIGVPTSVLNRSSSRPITWILMCSATVSYTHLTLPTTPYV